MPLGAHTGSIGQSLVNFRGKAQKKSRAISSADPALCPKGHILAAYASAPQKYGLNQGAQRAPSTLFCHEGGILPKSSVLLASPSHERVFARLHALRFFFLTHFSLCSVYSPPGHLCPAQPVFWTRSHGLAYGCGGVCPDVGSRTQISPHFPWPGGNELCRCKSAPEKLLHTKIGRFHGILPHQPLPAASSLRIRYAPYSAR